MPIYFEVEDLPASGSIVVFSRRDEMTRIMEEIQRFALLRIEPTKNRYGEASGVMNWQSDCMECGASYQFTTGLSTGSFYRRCKKCRKGRGFTGWPKGPRIQHTLLTDASATVAPEAVDADHWAAAGSDTRRALLTAARVELGKDASRDAVETKARETLLSLF